nr:BTAD domain-containing putative transcriptional regulator [Streptomyces coryli]
MGSGRQRTVLAALLADVGRVVSMDQLVHRVWGDAPPRRAKDTLYSYISRLRRVLPEGAASVARGHGGYLCTAEPATVDVHRFRQLIDQAGTAAADEQAVALLKEALALWRGEPFAGVDTPWFNAARDALGKERLAAELACTDGRLRLGEHAALLTPLSGRSADHPLDERLAAQYMLALYRCGRQVDALAHYRKMRDTLAEELGVEPGAELQRLHQAILGGDENLTRSAPPAEASWSVQSQLPWSVPDFVGRGELLQHLEELLTAPGAAPVVVSGTPGVGKSALAVHLGHRLRPAFPDGQWYVRLQGTSGRPRDPSEVLAALLRASGLDAGRVPQSAEDRAAAFRSRVADRRILLVLDDAASAEQVRPLLPGSAGVAVLITSRPDLRGLIASHAARTVRLGVLEPAEADALLAAVLGERQVRAEPGAAGRLGELCARLPLALRIAAANLAARPGHSLAAYATELAGAGRLAKLSIAGDREAAVRTAFDHSHAALEPATAHLFGLLGLHPGPDFTVEVAAALLDAQQHAAELLLDRLATAGLVQRTAADRYQFHDLLRLYAAERAEADPDREAAWQRLCAWYLAAADAATAFDFAGMMRLPRPRGESDRFADRHQALAWLEGERVNLVAVIRRAAAAGPRHVAWQLADQLRMYLYYRQHSAEWEAATTAGLSAAEGEGDVLAQAAMRHHLAVLYDHIGDGRQALEYKHRALAGFRQTGFAPGEAATLSNLAIHHGRGGEMRRAFEYQERAVDLLRTIGQPVQLANGLNTMGLLRAYLGGLESALDSTTEAIDLCHQHGRPIGAISPLINRALAQHCLGRYEAALADGTEALRLCQEHQKRHNETGANEILARIHRDTGHTDLARTHAERALAAARAINDPSAQVDCLINLAEQHALRGDPERATEHLAEALALARRHGFRHQEADARAALARIRLTAGDATRAAEDARAALATARDLQLLLSEYRALTALAAHAHTTGDRTAAAQHTSAAQRIREQTGYAPSRWERGGP